jgi:hypothetical protein
MWIVLLAAGLPIVVGLTALKLRLGPPHTDDTPPKNRL